MLTRRTMLGGIGSVVLGGCVLDTGQQDPEQQQPVQKQQQPITKGGRLKALVTSSTGGGANRYLVDPVNAVKSLKNQVSPRAYSSGANSCSKVWAPTKGDSLEHRQGIARAFINGSNFIFITNSVSGGKRAGCEVVQLASKTSGPLGANVQGKSKPPCSDRVIAYKTASKSSLDHAGGPCVVDTSLIVPFEANNNKTTAQFEIWSVANPSAPTLLTAKQRSKGKVADMGAVAMITLDDYRHLMFAFGNDCDEGEVFLSDHGSVTKWHSVAEFQTPSFFGVYQTVVLVPDGVGEIWLLGMHKSNGQDWVDLWHVAISDPYLIPLFTKMSNRHAYCSGVQTSGDLYCNFQGGSGAYVTPSGRLIIYGVEHYDDAYPGTHLGVKYGEFPQL